VSLERLEPFVAALDPAIGVLAFDVPGIGGSPLPPRPYRFSGLARLLGDLTRQLGHPSFDVLGISWGGGLAQQIALQNPRRCRRVVLVSTGTGALMVPARPSVLLTMATPRRHRDRAYLRTVAGEIYGGRVRTHPELVDDLLDSGGVPVSRRGYLYQLLAGVGWTSLPLLPLLRQPALVVAGDDDPIIPLANAHLMARLLPRGRLHVYPDGHLALLTAADELAPRIARFLREPDKG
jgi:poly(3-hydroxyalkanoate) depolymerase